MAVKTIVVLNNKGGVGKTTLSTILAEFLCLIRNKRVLLIDFDGQMNLTKYWIGTFLSDSKTHQPIVHPDYDETDPECVKFLNKRSAITDIYYGKQVLQHPTYLSPEDPEDTTAPRVDIISGSRDGMKSLLENIEREQTAEDESLAKADNSNRKAIYGFTSKELHGRLAEFCSYPELEDMYDYIIIDSGPSETPLFTAAINAATHIITPYQPEDFSFMGITTIFHNIETAAKKRVRPEPIKFVGLVPSTVILKPHIKTGMNEAMDCFGDEHLPEGVFIPHSADISTCKNKVGLKPASIFGLKPSNRARKMATAVCENLMERITNG